MQKNIRIQALFCGICHPAFSLFFFGSVGLIFGTLFAANANSSIFPMMRQVDFGPVSIVFHLVAQLLPFLIAAYAASLSRLWLLNAVCGCELFSFAYMGALVWIAFGSAGWLVRFLFLFSDIILSPVLCWYCFRRLMGDCDEKKDLLICIGITAITALINCLFISPFLAKII